MGQSDTANTRGATHHVLRFAGGRALLLLVGGGLSTSRGKQSISKGYIGDDCAPLSAGFPVLMGKSK
jgi:hypothetical protein